MIPEIKYDSDVLDDKTVVL